MKHELGSGQISKVWLITYLDNEDHPIEKALRISRTDSLPDQVAQCCYEWRQDHMGYEWHALLDYGSPNVLKTKAVVAWNHARKGFSVLSSKDVMALFLDPSKLEGIKYTLYATVSEYLHPVESLLQRIDRNPHFCLVEIQSIARQIFQGLADIQHVHPHLTHRDLKPANMLLSNGVIKICDFGYAKIMELSKTIVGSPLFMAPEILMGKPYTSKADIYSVFTILFQMATKTIYTRAQNAYELLREHEFVWKIKRKSALTLA